jgi:hypothetical protein
MFLAFFVGLLVFVAVYGSMVADRIWTINK